MKTLGDDIYLQRGEILSLDFDVRTPKGDPLMIFQHWKNPYLVITFSSNLYEQREELNVTYWLDLDKRIIERSDGTFENELVSFKRFISMEALYLETFSIDEALANYTNIVVDETSPYDVKNYLFYTDPNHDDNRIYKYVTAYVAGEGGIISQTWEEYGFRIIKQLRTDNFVEQGYLYDLKVVSGETVQEYIAGLCGEDIEGSPWTDTETQEHIDSISDLTVREEMQTLFDSGVPLMPTYDTVLPLQKPAKLFIGADMQRRQ